MRNSPRILRTIRAVTLVLVASLATGWLWLYLDSLHQRQRAEKLISDLRSFPFTTADFANVRALVIRYNGRASESFPRLPFLPPSTAEQPVKVIEGPSGSQLISFGPGPTLPTCTPQNCVFEIWIRTLVLRLPFSYKTELLLTSNLARVGLRPWALYARFEIREGKLWRSETSVAELRHAHIGPYTGFFPLEYDVVSKAEANMPGGGRSKYGVRVPIVTGGISDLLQTSFVQEPRAPINRAFDIRLRCFSYVTRACEGFPELAPSAWADYQIEWAKRHK